MPRKESARMRALREKQEELASEEAELAAGGQFVDEIPEIARLRESLGDGQFTVRISRKGDDSQFEKFPSMPLESFDPDSIASKYGGGVYKFDVIDSDGTYVKRFTASYSKLLKPRTENGEQKTASLLASPEFAIIQQMQQAHQAQMQAMNAQMTQLMGEVVKAVSSKPAGPDFKEMILALKGLKDLGGGDVASEMVKGALGMASKFMEMGRDSATAADPESNIMNKLIEFLPGVLAKLGEAKIAPKPLEHKPPEKPLIPHASPPAPEPAQPEATLKYPTVSAVMRELGPKIFEVAKADQTPEAAAAELVANIPENLEAEVDLFVQDSRAVDYILQIYPPLSLYVDWLRKFVAAIDKEFQEEPEHAENA